MRCRTIDVCQLGMHRIETMRLSIVLFDGFTALDIVGGYEVLANVPGIETEFVAAEIGLVNADTRRLALLGYRSFMQIEATDILYVPGGPGVFKGVRDAALLSVISRLHTTSTWTVGICNGVELLGAAGLLQDKQVTTNWFARAGVSASIDASLYLAGLVAGAEIAKTIQLGIEYYPDPPFGSGTPDSASPTAQAMVRMFEQSAEERIEALKPPY
jgi:putative intracellular protease/amidase